MNNRKIYTKAGDTGKTTLLGGKQVLKCHVRIDGYGTIDELNSFVGLLRDQEMAPHYKHILFQIQNHLFIAESLVAAEKGSEQMQLPALTESDVSMLESEIDCMNETLLPLSNFILPGGHQVVSLSHVCRTVCRRAERILVQLAQENTVDETIIRYFNRLSDYFFVLARKLGHDLGIPDQVWKPK